LPFVVFTPPIRRIRTANSNNLYYNFAQPIRNQQKMNPAQILPLRGISPTIITPEATKTKFNLANEVMNAFLHAKHCQAFRPWIWAPFKSKKN
jgi:hypothetical protein